MSSQPKNLNDAVPFMPVGSVVPVMIAGETDYVGILWRGKWLLGGALLLGIAAALAFLHLVTPRYSAMVQIVPTEQGGAAMPKNISGLASLAGISLPRGQVSQFGLALETMKSRDVAAALASDRRLMRRLFPEQWDTRIRTWRRPPDVLRGVKDMVKSVLALPMVPWSPPGPGELQKLLEKNLALAEDQKKSIATITFSNADPTVARDLLAALYTETDAHLRVRSDLRTTAYIAYIARKLGQVTLAEHRIALAEALADQERVLMMARSGQAFAADMLGSVSVSDRPVWPSVPLVLGAGIIGGLGTGTGLLLAADWLRRRRRQADVSVEPLQA